MSAAAGVVAAVRGSLVWPVLRKEFLQMRRDRVTLAMMVNIPLLWMLLFGWAIRTEVRHVPLLVVDASRTAQSRALVDALTASGSFRVVGTATSRDEVARRIAAGEAGAALFVPPEYARDAKRGRPARAQVVVDAADPLASAAALSGAQLAAQAAEAELLRAAGRRPPAAPLDLRVRPWYNPGLRSAVFVVPGIIGLVLSLTLITFTSIAVVRERERGTLEQLVVTPVTRRALMLGKLLPYVLVGYGQMTLVLLAGVLAFDVPVRGSVLALYVASAPYIVAMLAIGLVISTLARTQMQAMQLSVFWLLPNILLSGFLFPREAMPDAARWLGALLPLTHFLRITRGILLRGAGLALHAREVAALCALAAVLLAVSVLRFRRTAE